MRNYFSIEEAARLCGLTHRAFYMHVYRGHLQAIKMDCHKIFIERDELLRFMSRYGYMLNLEEA